MANEGETSLDIRDSKIGVLNTAEIGSIGEAVGVVVEPAPGITITEPPATITAPFVTVFPAPSDPGMVLDVSVPGPGDILRVQCGDTWMTAAIDRHGFTMRLQRHDAYVGLTDALRGMGEFATARLVERAEHAERALELANERLHKFTGVRFHDLGPDTKPRSGFETLKALLNLFGEMMMQCPKGSHPTAMAFAAVAQYGSLGSFELRVGKDVFARLRAEIGAEGAEEQAMRWGGTQLRLQTPQGLVRIVLDESIV